MIHVKKSNNDFDHDFDHLAQLALIVTSRSQGSKGYGGVLVHRFTGLSLRRSESKKL